MRQSRSNILSEVLTIETCRCGLNGKALSYRLRDTGSHPVTGLESKRIMAQENTGETVRRTLMLLRKISEYRGQWFRLTDLSLKSGLPKSTLHRFLTVFCEENILEKNEIVPGAYRYKRNEQK